MKERQSQEKICLGKAILTLREKAGLTGVQLCRKSGSIDPRTLNAIEKGRIRNPSIEILQELALGLGCLVKDLFSQAETQFESNFFQGSQKGVFHMEFPALGAKIISSTPPNRHFFCGKLILSAKRSIKESVLSRSAPVFLEVILGKIEFDIQGKTAFLKEGENLFYNGGLKHSIRNPLNRESALWLVTAPSFFH